MVDTAAPLVDEVLPYVRNRLRVISFPSPISFLFACDPKLQSPARRSFVHSVQAFPEQRAGERGVANRSTGTVGFMERFDCALHLYLHFLALVPDALRSLRLSSAR
jgi:hypothetical protein